MNKKFVAFDESGNSGANLLDPEQPIFVLASVHLSDEEAEELIELNQDEIKFVKLKRSSNGRNKIFEILNSDILSENHILISGFHKPFMVITKMVDLLIEPMLYNAGIDLYERGGNIAMSNMLYFTLPVFIGDQAFNAIQAAFVQMVRSPSNKNAKRFYDFIYKARTDLKNDEYAKELDMFLASKSLIHNYISEWDGSDLDPAIPAFVEQGSIWTSRLKSEFSIVHDASKPIQQNQLILEAMMSTSEKAVIVGYDRRKMEFPIKATGIEFYDSSLYPQIQIADIIASSAAYLLRASFNGNADQFAQTLLQTKVFSGNFYPVWPEIKFSPEELCTTEIGGIDPNNYMGAYVAQRLNGIPPKGKRSK